MKELSIYQIKDKALTSGRSVFSVQQLSNLIGKPKNISTVYMSRLLKKHLAFRLIKGKISFLKDDLIIATQLVEPSYISLDSALLFHHLIKQAQKNVECVTTRNSKNYSDLNIIYHKIPKELFFGYKRYNMADSYVFVAEPEKAIIDGLYLNRYSEIDISEHKKLNFSKYAEILKKFNGKGNKKLKKMIY